MWPRRGISPSWNTLHVLKLVQDVIMLNSGISHHDDSMRILSSERFIILDVLVNQAGTATTTNWYRRSGARGAFLICIIIATELSMGSGMWGRCRSMGDWARSVRVNWMNLFFKPSRISEAFLPRKIWRLILRWNNRGICSIERLNLKNEWLTNSTK